MADAGSSLMRRMVPQLKRVAQLFILMTHAFVVRTLGPMSTVGKRIRALAVAKGLGYGKEFASTLGVTYETLRKWDAGHSAPNRSRQAKLSAMLGVPAAEFMFDSSPIGGTALVAPAQPMSHQAGNTAGMDETNEVTFNDGTAHIPLMAAAGSMGPGSDQHDDVVIGRLALSQSWIGRVVKPHTETANLRFIHGYGDSMAPTFNDGDVLLVDGGVRCVMVDGVYVLGAQDRIYIKRVRRRMDGVFEVSSDNPTVKTVDVLDGSHPVDVLGKVVWIWNGKKV